MRPSVDLPQPDSPTSPTTSPSPIASCTSSTACTTASCRPAPNRLAARAARSSGLTKRLLTPSSATIGCGHAGVSLSACGCQQRAARPCGWTTMAGAVAHAASARAQRGEKAQPGGRLGGRGRRAGNLGERRAALLPRRRRADQPARIGVQRPRQHGLDRSFLDDAPGIHDRDAVGEPGHHREIVGDPDQRGAGLRAQRLHLGEDLRLDGDVERGGRLVGDQQQRPVQQRDRDGDALAQAAGELVRIGLQPLVGRGDADGGERRRAPAPAPPVATPARAR